MFGVHERLSHAEDRITRNDVSHPKTSTLPPAENVKERRALLTNCFVGDDNSLYANGLKKNEQDIGGRRSTVTASWVKAPNGSKLTIRFLPPSTYQQPFRIYLPHNSMGSRFDLVAHSSSAKCSSRTAEDRNYWSWSDWNFKRIALHWPWI